MPARANDDRTVLGRAFLILGAFSSRRDALELARLTERAGLPKATVHRLANQLTELGALELSHGKYRLGLTLFELGELVPRQRHLREVAQGFLRDLYSGTNQTVLLAIPVDDEIVYIDRIAGHSPHPSPAQPGRRVPIHSTASGKAILAFSSKDHLDRVIHNGLPRLTPYTIALPRLLVDQLREIRSEGTSYDREESIIGVSCVAAPIVGFDGHAVAAVSISGPTNRMDLKRFAPAVRTTGLGISRALHAREH